MSQMANNKIVIRYFIGGALHWDEIPFMRKGHFAKSGASACVRHRDTAEGYPPAIAPMMKNGSVPFAIESGRGVSGGSWEMSSPHAKNLTSGRRFFVS